MSYILSTANRFYTAIESTYGQAAPIAASNRLPGRHFHAHQTLQPVKRFDKTGARTFTGIASSSKRATAFEIGTYLTSWNGTDQPFCGPLFQAACGAAPTWSSDLVAASVQALQVQTAAPHGLEREAAVAYAGEIRFVSEIADAQTFTLNAPFSNIPPAGAAFAQAVTYRLGTHAPSLSIFDYWEPASAISRFVVGASVETMHLAIGGDFHEFTFNGPAADLLDSATFVPGTAGLAAYPAEPGVAAFPYAIVPGELGQAWISDPALQMYTLLGASITVKNNLQTRGRDYGSAYPQAVTPGARQVSLQFTVLAQDDAQSTMLYAAAKQRTPLPVMLQLGRQPGQLMAIYMPQVIPELPIYNDSTPRLQWQITNSRAQGPANDELFIAFA